jgi:hypothetical protein
MFGFAIYFPLEAAVNWDDKNIREEIYYVFNVMFGLAFYFPLKAAVNRDDRNNRKGRAGGYFC